MTGIEQIFSVSVVLGSNGAVGDWKCHKLRLVSYFIFNFSSRLTVLLQYVCWGLWNYRLW